MADGKDERHNPNRKVSKESGPHYSRPDGSSRPKPNAHSTPEQWEDYHAAAEHYRVNKGPNKQQPYDPYLNTWA